LRELEPNARVALHALVVDNPHPVSQCLLENLLATGSVAPSAGADAAAPEGLRETIGFGVESGGWSLGRPGWRSEPAVQPRAEADADEAGHDAELVHAGRVVARFRFQDSVRPDVRSELQALQVRGLAVGILSGDRPEKVAGLARDLGLPADRAVGGLSPQAKADWLEAHEAKHTLMLGDGANDSLAFDCALCRGTPVIHRGVLERKSDFYYLGRGIGGLRALFEIDVVRRRTQWAILIFSVVYNLLAVGLAVAGHMNPLVAAILMPINSLLTLGIVTSGMQPAFRRPV
jgi:Cu2+-exporting ATPase